MYTPYATVKFEHQERIAKAAMARQANQLHSEARAIRVGNYRIAVNHQTAVIRERLRGLRRIASPGFAS
jgi:hypothetical protein